MDLYKKNILITGGAGFIGGALIEKLISNYASSGVYIFGSYKILIKSFKSFNKNLNRNEINLSHIINNYLKMNKTFAESLETYLKYDLGSSTNIRNFNNLIKRSF